MKLPNFFLLVLLFPLMVSCGDSGSAGGEYHTDDEIPTDPTIDSLLGVDIDGDGLRDDVQGKIDSRYSNSTQRQAEKNLARNLQYGMVEFEKLDEASAARLAKDIMASVYCLRDLVDNPSRSISVLEQDLFNTPERIRAYIRLNEKLEAQHVEVDFSAEYCMEDSL